jgi:hypothetical protein
VGEGKREKERKREGGTERFMLLYTLCLADEK